MANRNQPLPAEVIAFVAAFPALAIARVRPHSGGGFIATVDCGSPTYVSDADAPHGGSTPEEAAEHLKAWLLDDLACGGKLGKRQYQPHWGSYDIRWRLGKHWKEKAAALDAKVIP